MSELDYSHKIIAAHAEILDTIVDTLPSGLLLLGQSGNILKLNQRARSLLMFGEHIDDEFISIKEFPDYLEPLRSFLLNAEENVQRGEISLELPSRPDEPSTLGFSLNILPPKMNDDETITETILALTFTDITQVLKDRQSFDKIKDELHQSKKLASIGTMISGVAHEMNNPLTGISMSAELSRMNLERVIKEIKSNAKLDADNVSTKLDKTLGEVLKIKKACDKAAALVGELLSYSKPTQLVTIPTNYIQLVEDTVTALKSHPDFGRFVMQVIPPKNLAENLDHWQVLADRLKIEQVFYNLCKNACDATEGVGTLTIRFSEGKSPSGDPWIVAHVKDNGPGIDTSVLARIFDPFFSTKGNKGVGLGLSISYRTLEQHGGLLSVQSEIGKWTEFQVALPLLMD